MRRRASVFAIPGHDAAVPQAPKARFAPVSGEEARRLRERDGAAPSAVAAPPTEEDPLGGIVSVARDRPPRVSPEVWNGVFPPNRQAVARRAAVLFRRGMDADAAVRAADRESVVAERTAGGTRTARLFCDLWALVPTEMRSEEAKERLADAAVSAWRTARRHGGRILASADPVRAAWPLREWRAPPGRCLVTGMSLGRDAEVVGGERVSPEAAPLMRSMARRFCEAVVEEAARFAAEAKAALEALPGPDPSVDPDDPATWGLSDGTPAARTRSELPKLDVLSEFSDADAEARVAALGAD